MDGGLLVYAYILVLGCMLTALMAEEAAAEPSPRLTRTSQPICRNTFTCPKYYSRRSWGTRCPGPSCTRRDCCKLNPVCSSKFPCPRSQPRKKGFARCTGRRCSLKECCTAPVPSPPPSPGDLPTLPPPDESIPPVASCQYNYNATCPPGIPSRPLSTWCTSPVCSDADCCELPPAPCGPSYTCPFGTIPLPAETLCPTGACTALQCCTVDPNPPTCGENYPGTCPPGHFYLGDATPCTTPSCSDDDCCLNEPLFPTSAAAGGREQAAGVAGAGPLPLAAGSAATAAAGPDKGSQKASSTAEGAGTSAAGTQRAGSAAEGSATLTEEAGREVTAPNSRPRGPVNGATATATCGSARFRCLVGSAAVPAATVCSGATCTQQECCQVTGGTREDTGEALLWCTFVVSGSTHLGIWSFFGHCIWHRALCGQTNAAK